MPWRCRRRRPLASIAAPWALEPDPGGRSAAFLLGARSGVGQDRNSPHPRPYTSMGGEPITDEKHQHVGVQGRAQSQPATGWAAPPRFYVLLMVDGRRTDRKPWRRRPYASCCLELRWKRLHPGVQDVFSFFLPFGVRTRANMKERRGSATLISRTTFNQIHERAMPVRSDHQTCGADPETAPRMLRATGEAMRCGRSLAKFFLQKPSFLRPVVNAVLAVFSPSAEGN